MTSCIRPDLQMCRLCTFIVFFRKMIFVGDRKVFQAEKKAPEGALREVITAWQTVAIPISL